MIRRIAITAAVVLLTLSLLFIAWQLRSVVLTFLVSLAIAAALYEPIEWLLRRGWPLPLALVTVYVVSFAGLIGLATLVVVPALAELDPLLQDFLPFYAAMQQRSLDVSGNRFGLAGVPWARLPTTDQLVAWLADGDARVVVQNVMGITQEVAFIFGQLALAVVIGVYWTADRLRFERLWLSLLPPDQRMRTRALWRKMESRVGAFIRSEVIQTALAGGLLCLGFWLLGVSYPFIIALVASLARLVPLLGVVLAIIPVVLVSSLAGPLVATASALYTLAILALLHFVVQPRLYSEDRYSRIPLILIMLALGDALGLIGLLVARPIALAVQIWLHDVVLIATPSSEPQSRPDLVDLRTRLSHIRERINTNEKVGTPRLTSLVNRLDALIAEIESKAAHGSYK
jgi:predicted PurR-regulated permease PerM